MKSGKKRITHWQDKPHAKTRVSHFAALGAMV